MNQNKRDLISLSLSATLTLLILTQDGITYAQAQTPSETASPASIELGGPAPDFKLQNQDGKTISLSALKGKPVLLYFYPKDDTPGCTEEACELRNNYAKYQKKGAVILGVSAQDSASHLAFKKKHHLPFDLVTDKDGSVAEAYGVGMIPILGLHKRQSILINSKGKIAMIMRSVDTKTHAEEVLKKLEEIE